MTPRSRLLLIAALLCGSTLLNYADRLAFSVVSVEVRQEFKLKESDYGQIVTLFLGAYALMYAVSGAMVDRMGTKRGFAVFMAAWSLAQMAHGFAMGKWSLAGCRIGLGLAEPAAWPAAAKAVKEWFAPAQRGLGMGIFNAGTSLGSAIAQPLVSILALRYGWRMAFIVTGAMGFLWLAAWWLIYYTPASAAVQQPEARSRQRSSAWAIFKQPGCYTLTMARFFTDPVIYFVIFWLPEYLRKERAFDLAAVGKYAWVPFAFGGAGYVFGGWLSGWLMGRGWPTGRARKFVMACGALCLPGVMLAPLVPEPWMAIGATCFLTFGHALWVANLQTLPTDLFRDSEIGTASGFTGCGGAIGGMIANLATGYAVMHFSYTPLFLLAGLLHPLSAVLVYRFLPEREFVRRSGAATANP